MKNKILKILRYSCQLFIIVFGMVAIIGCNGGGDDDNTNSYPIANITSPTNNSTFTEEETITFSGSGPDTEDGTLTGSSLVWTSSIDGQIGTGTSFSTSSLSTGTHTITLTATDSNNALGTDSVRITINQPALPDTGQTQSFTDTFGEDSDYTINPPSYTDIGDGTITDNVTGLIWQKEDDDITRIWDDANSFCNDLTLASYSDWRLPSEYELMSIVNCGTYYPSIDTTYFPGTNASNYWSSTTYAFNSSDAWYVYFYLGYSTTYDKSDSYYVRCVRGQDLDFGNFTDNGDGTVTDDNTGLIWQQSEGGQKTWENAITYCEDLSLAGYTDWRLPNKNELNSIIDYKPYYPAVDKNFFPGAHASLYWSSTTGAAFPSSAWYVSFDSGHVYHYDKKNDYYVRCVRAGQ